mmetsp:Transcript_58758/g.63417  ORF Transcript_58758/g.63417 Transcript_58758/m.63417 type:complete len:95 (+) Transcript_58758:311-595(+)
MITKMETKMDMSIKPPRRHRKPLLSSIAERVPEATLSSTIVVPATNSTTVSTSKTPETIDLTLDSSDDEDEVEEKEVKGSSKRINNRNCSCALL